MIQQSREQLRRTLLSNEEFFNYNESTFLKCSSQKFVFFKVPMLFINTVSTPYTIALVEGERKKIIEWKQWKTDDQREDQTLPVLRDMMKGKKWESLKAIVVVNGPGPFTRIRIGVSVANALAYMYHTPLYAVKNSDIGSRSDFQKWIEYIHLKKMKAQTIVEPYYDRPPNIMLSKKHPLIIHA